MTSRRAFVDLPFGQVLYREAGAGAPLLLLHASPGSSKQLEPMIAALAADARVIAPDTPGNGDSAPLPVAAPDITDYAAALPGLLDTLGIDRIAVYGSHTGASIAAELAILAPDRVSRIILDGVGVFSPAEQHEMLARYARPFNPDLDGAYLQQAFTFLRDQFLFWPWYARTPEARRNAGLPPPEWLHDWLVEVLKANTTYPLAYHAAFRWEAAARLALVKVPMLFLAADDDPLAPATRSVAATLPARLTSIAAGPDALATRVAAITRFLVA